MKHRLLIWILAISILAIIGVMVLQARPQRDTGTRVSEGAPLATMYKSPTCGCCGQYAAYLQQKGYGVSVEKIQDMAVVKEELGIPYELESCHTMEIAGYVVEGHVPEEAIRKLLEEKPDIKGIGMAGMPSGSPGMPGAKLADFMVYEILHDGMKGAVFMTI